MSEEFKHSRAISPFFINNKSGAGDDYHGVTDIAADPSQGTEDVFIVGQADKCGTERDIPEVPVPITQLERGEIETYLHLANLDAEPVGGLELTDFSSGLVDAVLYVREEELGAVEATIWVPQTAIQSLSLAIDADERLVRTFELIGEDRRVLTGANRILVHKTVTAGTGVSGSFDISVTDPVAVVHPTKSGVFILRVDRTRDGVVEKNIDFTFDDGADEINIADAEALDIYNYYYTAASFGTGGDPTSVDSDPDCFLKAEFVTVLIHDGTTELELDNITSLSFDASLTRLNEATVGTTVKIKDITETPVTLSVSGRAKSDFVVEKAFMGQLADTNMISSVNDFTENVRVTIKIYDSADKTNFLLGYQISDLAFNDSSFAVTANEFATIDFGASTTNVKITAVEGNLT